VLTDELDRLASAIALTGAGLDDIGDFAGATYDYRAANPALGRLLQWEGLTRGPAVDVAAARRTTGTRSTGSRRLSATASLMAGLDAAHLMFALIALAAWWQTVPQLAEMITSAQHGAHENVVESNICSTRWVSLSPPPRRSRGRVMRRTGCSPT
jgi:hypothetical protein